MNRTKNLTIINCLASAFIVYFITVPGHELLHVLTSGFDPCGLRRHVCF